MYIASLNNILTVFFSRTSNNILYIWLDFVENMLLLFFLQFKQIFFSPIRSCIYSSLKNELDANNIFAHTRTTEYKASIYPRRGQIQRKFLIYMILCKSKKKGLCTRILSYIGRNMVQYIYTRMYVK